MLKLHRCLWWWARIEIKRSEAQGRWSEQREHVPGTSMVLRWGPGPSNFLCHESQESQIRSWSHPGLRAHHEQQVSIPGWKGQWRKTCQSLEYIPHIFTVTQILGSCNQLLHMWMSCPFSTPKEGKICRTKGCDLFFIGMDSLQKTSKNYYNYFVARKSLKHSPLPSLTVFLPEVAWTRKITSLFFYFQIS